MVSKLGSGSAPVALLLHVTRYSIYSNSSIILPGLRASIGVTHSYSSRPFLCNLGVVIGILWPHVWSLPCGHVVTTMSMDMHSQARLPEASWEWLRAKYMAKYLGLLYSSQICSCQAGSYTQCNVLPTWRFLCALSLHNHDDDTQSELNRTRTHIRDECRYQVG